MDQSENFEPDKKRSARRPQEQEGSSAPNRRQRFPQHQQPPHQHIPTGVAAVGGLAGSHQSQSYEVAQLQATGGQYTVPSTTATAAAAMATSTSYQSGDPYTLQQQEQQRQQQILYEQQQQLKLQQQQAAAAQASYVSQPYPATGASSAYPYAATAAVVSSGIPQMPVAEESYVQPRSGRLPADRPLMKLSVSLIDTYKHINTVYYEERDARRKSREKTKGTGTNNNGWDDDNYDYIITTGELFYGRYRIKERIGKGSFGQVVRAEDIESRREVAIKIIKSKKPFLLQAKTEIELLTHLFEKDQEDQHNCGKNTCTSVSRFAMNSSILTTIVSRFSVRLLTHFMYRNHQCLVFEMLSLNLYELLKNTQFGGVSLNLIRKFAKQVLKALSFLARKDVDIIHCDLKPENILLRHPKKSAIKVIDFGSSCHSNKRMYSYIQSRFYRSPEVMLGLPYTVAIDMWSLGCILVEMHTGEPLFSGSDQFDQMQKIVKILGMVPDHIMEQTSDHTKQTFFEKDQSTSKWVIKQTKEGKSEPAPKNRIVPSTNAVDSLTAIITAGSSQKKKYPHEASNSSRNYELFIDLVHKMLAFEPKERIKPLEALEHPFITSIEAPTAPTTS
jgi:dual specificity tyrosine-phosphorylation-regulated kinase 1